ncbi:hypothetical protein PFLUV_G00115550 [Perca fluviatilis]|uniref:BRCT domain-containing protein n=1 Tax=Perca fluviatilis TaxID=8168 RepID=A0A6A5EAJ9_PERFL|nr:hypothetical protein PFLUV_G00115550 [Perca fluviatilis]
MSPEVTHIVAEVENSIHSQELQDLVRQYTQVVPVQKDWLESCFSKQRKVELPVETRSLVAAATVRLKPETHGCQQE